MSTEAAPDREALIASLERVRSLGISLLHAQVDLAMLIEALPKGDDYALTRRWLETILQRTEREGIELDRFGVRLGHAILLPELPPPMPRCSFFACLVGCCKEGQDEPPPAAA